MQPDPAAARAYLRIFPTRSIGWDPWRQLLVITDRTAPGWREFVMELMPAPMPESDEEQEELEKSIGHLPRIVDEGQLMVGCYAPLTLAYVEKRARERMTFLELGSTRYAASIAEKNRAIGKSRIRAAAGNMAARLNEIRRWFGPLSGEGTKIPLVPGHDFTH